MTEEFDSPEARLAMRKRHVELGLRLQRIALYAIEELERKAADGEPLGLSAEDAEKLLDVGRKLECLAAGGNKPDADDGAPIPSKKPN